MQGRLQVNIVTRTHHTQFILTEYSRSRLPSLKFRFALILPSTTDSGVPKGLSQGGKGLREGKVTIKTSCAGHKPHC